ncbi:hypothetical protein [Caudoviricetes sp.]|nr:hypothetical protein [Caudoviricetes sp.]
MHSSVSAIYLLTTDLQATEHPVLIPPAPSGEQVFFRPT